MVLNKDFLTGFITGTVVGAVGYRLYEEKAGELCRLVENNQSFQIQNPEAEPTMEELLAQKERLADLIAEYKVE